MTDYKEKLERLRAQIEESAQKDADKLIADAEKQAEEMIAEEYARLDKSLSGSILDRTARFEAAERRRLAESRYAADRKVLLHRNALVDGLFDEIKAELAEFVKTEKYVAYLRNSISSAEKAEPFTDDTIVFVRPADIEAARSALSGEPLHIEADKGIAIGGVILKYPSKGKFIDLTIDTALENERGAFSAKSEMQLS